MSLLTNLYRGQTDIDFRPLWRRSVVVSAALAVASLVLLAVVGLNLSIDFEGGGVWEVPVDDSVTVADARDAVPGLDDARIQLVEEQTGGKAVRVHTSAADLDRDDEIVAALAELGGATSDDVSVSTVGPTWGSQITGKAVRALLLFFVAVAGYLAWRLEWRMAIGALAAVVHDLAITTGVYALFSVEVSPATVIALLTILGYSLYDTIVVFDKILENERSPAADGLTHLELINRSMNDVLMRSVNTTITTVLPVLSMLTIGGLLLGGASLWDFALALFIGLLLGTYSSIFVAAPILAWLKERQPESPEYRRRLRKRPAASTAAGAAASGEGDDEGDEPAVPTNGSGPATSGPIAPRPRKQRGRSRR